MLTRGDVTIDLVELSSEFHFGPWLARRTGASLHLALVEDTLSVLITPIDDRVDLEISGELEHTDGMLEEFGKIEVELIEKQSKSKQLERTTLLINGKCFSTCATGNSSP